jgi:CBS domain containing-hemolysin-like protein
MTATLGLAALVALIFANGYFVAAEFGYVAARRSRLEERAAAGDRRAPRALDVVGRLSFMLSGAQLGITVTSLLVGYVAEPTLGRALEPVVGLFGLGEQAAAGAAFTAAFVLATAAQMVLGELAPKNLAIAKPEAFALGLARTTSLFTRLAGPIIKVFDSSSNGLLRLLGIEPVEEVEGGASSDELDHIISQSAEEGALSDTQAELLRRSLDFGQLRAADAMVPRTDVVPVPITATCDELRTLALEAGHSRFPVIGESLDDVRGVVQAKDIFAVPAGERARTGIQDLVDPLFAVPETAQLATLLADMRTAHSPLAVIVDEHGGTAGVLTLEDVVEELVGDIRDEHDEPEAAVERSPEGVWLVPGVWRLHEVARDTGVALPEGDYDTLGGLVMDRLGRVPEAGDRLLLDGVRIEVREVSGPAVQRVALVPVEDAAPASPRDGETSGSRE